MKVSERTAVMEVDLSALRHNLAVVRALAGDREVIASVKANAYGFGVVEMGRALTAAGIRKLWTGNIEEAILLREAAVDAEILLFGSLEPHQVDAVLRHELQPTICNDANAAVLAQAAVIAGRPVPVWIKVDAGLGRFGVAIDEAPALIERAEATTGLELRGIYTHLPFGSTDGARWAGERETCFHRMIDGLTRRRGPLHATTQVWGSAGLLAGLSDASSAVCVGHALFGLSPLEPGVGSHPPLRPLVHSLSAPVLQVAHRGGGPSHPGGYGQVGGLRGATLGIGLADGLARARHGDAQVIVSGRCRPVRAFTLENLIIDVDDVAVEAYDRALVIGAAGSACITLENWAEWAGLSPLELMLSLSGRIAVRYVDLARDAHQPSCA
ncbi:alanine racemase [Sphingopyxis sp.]|uniref:alanine racemase n=1 Tax=Sphingopyxis sp. TaxID=1908224 RepID=UPI001E07D7C8|nr:alanine racemase [Sphingopyxis sp.]MBW8296332.1 alanine racemase [Sphingopyxis sp.]